MTKEQIKAKAKEYCDTCGLDFVLDSGAMIDFAKEVNITQSGEIKLLKAEVDRVRAVNDLSEEKATQIREAHEQGLIILIATYDSVLQQKDDKIKELNRKLEIQRARAAVLKVHVKTANDKIKEIEIDGVTKYAPAYIINGESTLISHQNKVVYCDTEQEAQEYLED